MKIDGRQCKGTQIVTQFGDDFLSILVFFYFAQFSWRCVSCTVNHKWGTDREVSPGQYIHLRPIWLRRIQPRYSVYNIFLPNSVVWSSKLDGLWCQYVTRQNLPRGGGWLRIGTWLLLRCREKCKQMNSASFPSKMLNPTRNTHFCIQPFSFPHKCLFFSLSLPYMHMCPLYFVKLLDQKLVCQKSRRETRWQMHCGHCHLHIGWFINRW